jgi:hypothetical protein
MRGRGGGRGGGGPKGKMGPLGGERRGEGVRIKGSARGERR